MEKNIEILNILLSDIENLKPQDDGTLDKQLRSAEMIIRKVFGESSEYGTQLRLITFSPKERQPLWTPEDYLNIWERGRTSFQNLVKTMLDELEIFGATENIPSQSRTNNADPKNVFVVYGRDLDIKNSMFTFLHSLDLHPIEWSEARKRTGKTNPYISEILDVAFRDAQAIVVIMSPEDVVYLHEKFQKDDDKDVEREPNLQARPNVIFEAGIAMGREENRTVLVEIGAPKSFSDIDGRHVLRLTNSTKQRQELIARLKTAGCQVNQDGTDWHDTGNFEINKLIVKTSEVHENTIISEETPSLDPLELEILVDLQKTAGSTDAILSQLKYKDHSEGKIFLSIDNLGDNVYIKIGSILFGQTYPNCTVTHEGRKYLSNLGIL